MELVVVEETDIRKMRRKNTTGVMRVKEGGEGKEKEGKRKLKEIT